MDATAAWQPLERDSGVPLAEQVRLRLLRFVADGASGVHRRFPSERVLSEQLGVSRLTVRKALSELADQGVLYTRRGAGTFVAEPKIAQPLRQLTGFSEDVRARGQHPSSSVLDQALVPAPLEVVSVLQVPLGSELVRLRRVRCADGEPLALETCYLPHTLCPGLLSEDLTATSLYSLLRDRYGLSLSSATQTIEAAEPTAEERRLLHLPTGTPVLRTARITRSQDGRVVEFVRAAYRADRFQMTVELGERDGRLPGVLLTGIGARV